MPLATISELVSELINAGRKEGRREGGREEGRSLQQWTLFTAPHPVLAQKRSSTYQVFNKYLLNE